MFLDIPKMCDCYSIDFLFNSFIRIYVSLLWDSNVNVLEGKGASEETVEL